MQNRVIELEQFKSGINLAEYACAVYGFCYDRKSSSRRSAIVRHANGDKLVITRRPNNHYVYFNVSGTDSGTIIDFIQSRNAKSLGLIRKELRAWTVVDANSAVPNNPIQLEPSQHDAGRVLKSWTRAIPVQKDSQYLVQYRNIPSSTYLDPVFDGQIRVDDRRNILFAHRNDENEITGFEMKNRKFTGFAPGGVKSLFQSKEIENARVAVLCETAIDLLSFATIFGVTEKRFLSTAGQVSEQQLDTLSIVLNGITSLEYVWLAFDNDVAGRKLSERVASYLSEQLEATEIIPKLPSLPEADWNDVLRRNQEKAQPPNPTTPAS